MKIYTISNIEILQCVQTNIIRYIEAYIAQKKIISNHIYYKNGSFQKYQYF